MMRMLTLCMTLFCTTLATGVALAGESPMGQWARGDGNAKVRMAQCGANICATNTWIKPGTPSEKAGDVLVMKLDKISDSKYTGTAFDPQRNRNYQITLTVNGASMTTTGCVLGGLLCKGVNWSKIN